MKTEKFIEPLTERQQKFIRDNHRRMWTSEMANALQLTDNQVVGFMQRNNLPLRNPRTTTWKHLNKQLNKPVQPGYFDYNNKSNFF